MKGVICLLRAELWKMRHSRIYLIHVLCPVIVSLVALLYFHASKWSERDRILAYAQVIGMFLPIIVSIVCAQNVELEERGHFQTLLGVNPGKCWIFVAKWLALEGLAMAAVVGAFLLFGIGQEVLQEKMMSVRQYLMAGVVLWCAGIPLYLEHLFLNLKFSKVISMGISIVQFLLSALFLTGLGDGRWQWFPCTWSNRGTTLYLLGAMEGPQAVPGVAGQARVCLLLGLLICAIIILWFRNYEGRECHD